MNNYEYQKQQPFDAENTIKNGGDFGTPKKNSKHNIYSENNSKKSKKSSKFIFGVLLVLAAGTLIFGFASLSKNIYGPNSQFANKENTNVEQSNLVSDLLEMQNTDTDKDGLSDYDELYIYSTSPYLPDTDSDGYLDKQEIDSGHDPLCPSGQDCRGIQTSPPGIEEGPLNTQPPLVDNPDEGDQLPQEIIDELQNLTPDDIRDLLRASGQLTEEQINSLDDETLMEIYREVLVEQ